MAAMRRRTECSLQRGGEKPTEGLPAGHKVEQLKGNVWLVLRAQGIPTALKLERNLSLVTAIIIDGFGETYLGGSHAIVTIETHWREGVSHPLVLSQAVSLKSLSLDNQALLSVFLSSKSSKATLLS